MTSQPMSGEYTYEPLENPRQIRTVTLEPGAWSSDICCTLAVVGFDSPNGAPIYDALSYVWGDPKNRGSIQLNRHTFSVTENLYMVLRRLRDPVHCRVLWIDAICINQNDNDEKSHQVAMMGEIYSKCQQTIIWLGEDSETVGKGERSIYAVNTCTMLDILANDKHWDELQCFSTAADQRTEISKEYVAHFEAFRTFVELPWWSRIWVIQELVLPQNVRFLYSSEEFSYTTLKSVVQNLTVHGLTCCKQYRYTLREEAFNPILTFQERVEPMVSTRETWTNQGQTTLFDLRRLFPASQATEKRDLFYAVLGLVTSWRTGEPLYLDYKIRQEKAITEAVFKCILEQGELGFLQGERSFRDEERDKHMPTWIPDCHFTTVPPQWVIVEQRRLRIFSCFSASSSLSQDSSQLQLGEDKGHLRCQTLKVGKIVSVGPVCEALEHFEQAPDIFRQWMEMVGLGIDDWPEQPPAEGSLADSFWRTMINDSTELETNMSPFYRRANAEDYAIIRGLWKCLLSSVGEFLLGMLTLSIKTHDDLMAQAPAIVYHVFVCLWHRRLFVTGKGWIGLAPEDASVGDEVHALLGAPAPFILRMIDEANEKNQQKKISLFRVVGNAYLHQIMAG